MNLNNVQVCGNVMTGEVHNEPGAGAFLDSLLSGTIATFTRLNAQGEREQVTAVLGSLKEWAARCKGRAAEYLSAEDMLGQAEGAVTVMLDIV